MSEPIRIDEAKSHSELVDGAAITDPTNDVWLSGAGLLAQAHEEGVALVTRDDRVREYNATVVAA